MSFLSVSCSILPKRGRVVGRRGEKPPKQEAAVPRENEELKQLLAMRDKDVAQLLGYPWDSPTVSFYVVERERTKPWVDTVVFNEVREAPGIFSRNLTCLIGASCKTVHFLEGFCSGSLKPQDC